MEITEVFYGFLGTSHLDTVYLLYVNKSNEPFKLGNPNLPAMNGEIWLQEVVYQLVDLQIILEADAPFCGFNVDLLLIWE